MNKILHLLIVSALLVAHPSLIRACEIVVAVDGVQQEKYKAGDLVVLKITVVLKHRNCDVSMDQTDIRVSGSQITGTTKWVNTKERTWEKKIRIKILGDKSGKAIVTAERTCERDGGRGSLILFTDG